MPTIRVERKKGRYEFLLCSVHNPQHPDGRIRFRIRPAKQPAAQDLAAELGAMSDHDILSALPEIQKRLSGMPWRQRRPLEATRVKITMRRHGVREYLEASVYSDGRRSWSRRLGPSGDPKVRIVAEKLVAWTGHKVATSKTLEKELNDLKRQHYKRANHQIHMGRSMAAGPATFKGQRFGSLGLKDGNEILFSSMPEDLLEKLANADEIRHPYRAEHIQIRKLFARNLLSGLAEKSPVAARAVWNEVVASYDQRTLSPLARAGLRIMRRLASNGNGAGAAASAAA
jgi:hypothetical protein